jgi:hypothetical protein
VVAAQALGAGDGVAVVDGAGLAGMADGDPLWSVQRLASLPSGVVHPAPPPGLDLDRLLAPVDHAHVYSHSLNITHIVGPGRAPPAPIIGYAAPPALEISRMTYTPFPVWPAPEGGEAENGVIFAEVFGYDADTLFASVEGRLDHRTPRHL